MFDAIFQLTNTTFYAIAAWLMASVSLISLRFRNFLACASFHLFVVVARSALLVLYPDIGIWRYIHFVTMGMTVIAGLRDYHNLHAR